MAPAKEPVGEGVGAVPEQFVRKKPMHPTGSADGRYTAAKSKAVRQPGQLVLPLGQALVAVGLPLLELPQ